jgi:hypothetical protein
MSEKVPSTLMRNSPRRDSEGKKNTNWKSSK